MRLRKTTAATDCALQATWLGSGEALESVSLATGLLVSSTQTSKEDADYEVVSVATGSRIHEQGHLQSQSEITLVGARPRLPWKTSGVFLLFQKS